jgi:hypothetical protein
MRRLWFIFDDEDKEERHCFILIPMTESSVVGRTFEKMMMKLQITFPPIREI